MSLDTPLIKEEPKKKKKIHRFVYLTEGPVGDGGSTHTVGRA